MSDQKEKTPLEVNEAFDARINKLNTILNKLLNSNLEENEKLEVMLLFNDKIQHLNHVRNKYNLEKLAPEVN
jgi:hypothetical protein